MADYIPSDPAELCSYLDQIDQEGVQARGQWSGRWEQNVKIMRNNIWPDSAEPLFAHNIIAPAIRRKSGLLVESRPVLDVKVTKNGLQTTANVLKATIRALWDEQQIPMSLEELASYLGEFGNGLFKVTYDPTADYGEGNIIIKTVDPRMVIVDPAVTKSYCLDKAQYIREESIVSLAWVKQRFPRTTKDLEADSNLAITGNDQHKFTWVQRALNRMFKKRGDGNVESAIPRVYLREYWIADPTMDAEGNMKYPGGRRILRTGTDVILNPDANEQDPTARYGQQNPYFDGLWPYEMLDNEPDPDHPWGHAEVEALRKLNESFNRVGNTTVSTLIKNLEWIIADANSLRPEDVTDLKRLQAIVMEKQPGRSVERMPPSQPTATNMDFMRLMISLVEMEAGLSDGAMQGKGRVELRSQPQLEGLQQVAQVLIRAQARRMESFLERVGQKLVSRIFQFYTDDRVMSYVDKDQLKEYHFQKDELRAEIVEQAIAAKKEEAKRETQKNIDKGQSIEKALVMPDTLEPEEIEEAIRGAWRLFRFKIVPFSSLASNRAARAGQLMELSNMQLMPPSMVLEELGFDNYEDLLKKYKADLDMRTALGIPPPEPPQKKGGKKK